MNFLMKYSNIIIVLIYTYFLFFHIKDKEYIKMLGATLITAFLICMNKNSGSVEGLTNAEIDSESTILGEEYIEQSGPVKFVPFESTTRMGPYDGLCIDGERKKVDKLISNEELQTYLGVQGPIQLKKSIDVDTGVVVDGDDSTEIKKKAILSNNPVSINCCDTSPFSSSNGCVCVTDKQKKFIRSRGHNKTSPDYV
jgi:hypothetical protein